MSSRDYSEAGGRDRTLDTANEFVAQPVLDEDTHAPVDTDTLMTAEIPLNADSADANTAEASGAPAALYVPACGVLCDLFWWARPASSNPPRKR